jgi:hypothetical protein
VLVDIGEFVQDPHGVGCRIVRAHVERLVLLDDRLILIGNPTNLRPAVCVKYVGVLEPAPTRATSSGESEAQGRFR